MPGLALRPVRANLTGCISSPALIPSMEAKFRIAKLLDIEIKSVKNFIERAGL